MPLINFTEERLRREAAAFPALGEPPSLWAQLELWREERVAQHKALMRTLPTPGACEIRPTERCWRGHGAEHLYADSYGMRHCRICEGGER